MVKYVIPPPNGNLKQIISLKATEFLEQTLYLSRSAKNRQIFGIWDMGGHL